MRWQDRTAEGRLADRQHGLVTRAQLLDAGLSAGAVERRLRKGVLLVVHPGVYRVGHRAPSEEARYLAAVLACGDGALLCGRAAAHLLSLIRGLQPPPEVIAPTERRIEGIRTRRSRCLDDVDRFAWRGVPCTSVARTLVDLAAELEPEALGRACHEAGVLHRTTPAHVEEVLARRPNAKGAAKLRRVLLGEERVTLSALERRFLTLLRDHDLPLPETNRRVGSRRVDCRWPDHRLTVELDSYRYHSSRHAWEQDRRREREAYARGDAIRRYTFGDVSERPASMLRELGDLLRPSCLTIGMRRQSRTATE